MSWQQVSKQDPRAAALADRHYSRQTVGSPQFMPPGRTLVLLHRDEGGMALWSVVYNRDPAGAWRWRVNYFRNESLALSSTLVREATEMTREQFGVMGIPLTTEVDPAKTRPKRDPGRCFRRAGWLDRGVRPAGHGRPELVLLEAP